MATMKQRTTERRDRVHYRWCGVTAGEPGDPVAAGTGAFGAGTGFAPAPCTWTAVVVAGAIVTCVKMAAFCCVPFGASGGSRRLGLQGRCCPRGRRHHGFLTRRHSEVGKDIGLRRVRAEQHLLDRREQRLRCELRCCGPVHLHRAASLAAAADTALAWVMLA